MAVILKEVKVKRTIYTFNTTPAFIKQYIDNCVNAGSRSDLFKNPNIAAGFYDEGNAASGAIRDAINKHALFPTKANYDLIFVKADFGRMWLNRYAGKVEVIANDNANRTTREEAATNILLSYLTPQKLKNAKKGKPEAPEIVAVNITTGEIDARIVNGADYQPSQTTFILIEVAAEATLRFVKDQLMIEATNKGQVVVKTAAKKGKYTHFVGLNSALYAIYAYAQNGRNQVSELSKPVFVRA